jgi:Tfp pilus assembly protein PilW
MVCRITCTKARRRSQAGFTLAETWFAMALGLLVASTLASFTLYNAVSMEALKNYTDLERNSQRAIDTMTQDIRQTRFLTACTSNRIEFMDGDFARLSYVYSPEHKTLSRVKGSTNLVLLTECDQLAWSIFQRNPVAASYDQYPTATVTNTKLINISWICSRRIRGARMNTEAVQTAKIVIRKQ